MNAPARITVTAAEFTRQFGHLRQAPGDRPVHVTHHGRETHVLLSAGRYQELRRETADPVETALPALGEVAGWIEHAVIVLAGDGTVTLANHAAHVMLGQESNTLDGRSIWDAAPALAASPVGTLIRAALQSREHGAADLPSPVRPDRWLHVAAHPGLLSTTLLFRDITDTVRRDRRADEPGAVALALDHHSGIARVRLNPRGHVELANPAFCALVRLSESRIVGVALADLLPTARKPEFRAAFNRVLRDDEPAETTTELLVNDGRSIAVRAVLAPLRGVYGQEGAVLVATPA